jgi:UDP-glucuronate 4-epimerase
LNILVTGVAGFIGSKLSLELLKNSKIKIYGIDNLNDYYSVKLKKKRIYELRKFKNFNFIKLDLKNSKKLNQLKNKINIKVIFHFAAQAGVRFTLAKPKKYFDDNIVSFFNIVNFAKEKKIKKFFFASSSSVYGDQSKFPVNETYKLNTKNFYGFSKDINELTAKTFSKIFDIQFIGLRFFTVFGEWGRPDMLIFKYIKSNLSKKIFYLNENGKHNRDFTYIDDVVKILIKLNKVKLKKNFYIFNVCSNKPLKIFDVVKKINKFFRNFKYIPVYSKALNKIEVNTTHGNNKEITKILKKINFSNFDKSLKNTIEWYKSNKINKIT